MATMWRTVIGGCLAVWAAMATTPAQAIEDSAVCGAETIRQERLQGIPSKFLHAISLVESGRYDSAQRVSFAWPWTVMAEGEGRFLPSKAAAIAEVRKLQARGVKNIDVGCMQVNLLAHKNAFHSLDEAFDPAANVAYAARFLTGLYSSTNDWATAGAYYHSQTPSLAASYKAKLLSTWKKVKGRGADDRMQMALLDNRPPVGMFHFRSVDSDVVESPSPSATIDPAHQLRPSTVPAHHPDNRSLQERAEARRIANAYRQARLAEYRLRKEQQQQAQQGQPVTSG